MLKKKLCLGYWLTSLVFVVFVKTKSNTSWERKGNWLEPTRTRPDHTTPTHHTHTTTSQTVKALPGNLGS